MDKKSEKKIIKSSIYVVLEENSKLNVDSEVTSFINEMKEKELFKGEAGECFVYFDKDKEEEIVLLGLGKADKLINKKALELAGKVSKSLKKQSRDMSLCISESELDANIVQSLIEGFHLGQYAFDTHKSDRKDRPYSTEVSGNLDNVDMKEALNLSSATILARELTNEPSNVIYPESLANKVIELGKEAGFEVEIKDEDEIKALKMDAFLSVARGSDREPKLIVMRYKGNDKSDEVLGLVGKGITYDAGGYCLKPANGMVDMNMDMGGAAAVIGAMTAIAKSELKVNVVGVVAACENLIDGKAYKTGDIISSMAGKTIFVGNTDAEGRLTLVDAVHYIQVEENATKVVDIATLTGAALHTVGSVATSSVSNNDEFFELVSKGFDLGSERVHRLPIYDEYLEMLKYPTADLTNMPGRPGTILAGCFVGDFAKDVPFTHLDIAATGMLDKEDGVYSKGASGAGARPLYYLAKLLSEK